MPGARRRLAAGLREGTCAGFLGLVVGVENLLWATAGRASSAAHWLQQGPVEATWTEPADSSTAASRAKGPQEENKWKKEVISP